MKFRSARLVPLVFLLGRIAVLADTITPDTFLASLDVGSSTTLRKIVTITPQLTVPLDIFFLADTTGSMTGTLENVRLGFGGIVGGVAGVAADPAFAVGEYKDLGEPFVYRLNQNVTTSSADAQTALGSWVAGGGFDIPEGNLFGLLQAAATTGWRPGSMRFLVWVGDAPGHNPRNGATETGAIAALQAAGVSVLAASAMSGPGLNSACSSGDCTEDQANRITAAAGGAFLGNLSNSVISAAITNALVSTLINYSSVSLQLVGAPAGVSVSLPGATLGTFNRSVERSFPFDVSFTGLAPGTYDFSINALVDGRVISTETDSIIVSELTADESPEPSTMVLLVTGLVAVGLWRRRRG